MSDLITKEAKVCLGSSNDELDVIKRIVGNYDFVVTLRPRLRNGAYWVPTTQIENMPNPVSLLMENTSSAQIRLYYSWIASGFHYIESGATIFWPNLAWPSAANVWRLFQSSGSTVSCKITLLGNY